MTCAELLRHSRHTWRAVRAAKLLSIVAWQPAGGCGGSSRAPLHLLRMPIASTAVPSRCLPGLSHPPRHGSTAHGCEGPPARRKSPCLAASRGARRRDLPATGPWQFPASLGGARADDKGCTPWPGPPPMPPDAARCPAEVRHPGLSGARARSGTDLHHHATFSSTCTASSRITTTARRGGAPWPWSCTGWTPACPCSSCGSCARRRGRACRFWRPWRGARPAAAWPWPCSRRRRPPRRRANC